MDRCKDSARAIHQDNVRDNTIGAHLEKRTVGVQGSAYNFWQKNITTAEGCEEFLTNAFIRPIDAKEGYAVKDLQEPQAVLAIRSFNPIFHPKKPKWLTAKRASTFLKAMSREIKVYWA